MIFSSHLSVFYLELEQGLDQTKSLYHKKEYRRAVETLEEVLSTSSNRRLLSEVGHYRDRHSGSRLSHMMNYRHISCWQSVTKDWVT